MIQILVDSLYIFVSVLLMIEQLVTAKLLYFQTEQVIAGDNKLKLNHRVIFLAFWSLGVSEPSHHTN